MTRNKFATAMTLLVALVLTLTVRLAGADTFVGDEAVVTASSSSLPLAVGSAISGRTITCRAFVLNSSSGQLVQFQDGSGGTTIGNFYCAANTPVTVTPDILSRIDNQGGIITTAGNGLFITGSGGTLTITARILRR